MATETASDWNTQKKRWTMLKELHPASLDLRRISLLRDARLGDLGAEDQLTALLPELGLNNEGLSEFPLALLPHCGQGLRVWQYPIQFSPYLVQLSRLRIRSYLEIGIRHGGSFVTTAEYLERFDPLEFAVGVDVIPCPSMSDYARLNPKAEFVCVNTLGPEFPKLLDRLGSIDLAFIDSHHEEKQCQRELGLLEEHVNMIAFHDISNVGCPGVRNVWSELAARSDYECFEYTAQYPGLGPYMGIGLAVKKSRFVQEGQDQ